MASGAVVCGACQHSYKWKPELAGKRGKCKCGGRVEFPVDDPRAENPYAAPKSIEEELGSMPAPAPIAPARKSSRPAVAAPPVAPPVAPAPAPVEAAPRAGSIRCAGCSAPMGAGAVICIKCGMDARTGKQMGTTTSRENPALKRALTIVGTLALILGGLVAFVVFLPEVAEKASKPVAIAGLIIWIIGMYWARWVATQDNLGLRLASRFIPFVALVIIFAKCATAWNEIKVPVLIMLGGAVIGVGGVLGHFYLLSQGFGAAGDW